MRYALGIAATARDPWICVSGPDWRSIRVSAQDIHFGAATVFDRAVRWVIVPHPSRGANTQKVTLGPTRLSEAVSRIGLLGLFHSLRTEIEANDSPDQPNYRSEH